MSHHIILGTNVTKPFILGTDGKKSLIICVNYCFIDRFLCHYGVMKTNMSHHIILGTDGEKSLIMCVNYCFMTDFYVTMANALIGYRVTWANALIGC